MALARLPGKLLRHLRLLRDDPERFGSNLLRLTNPRRFEERLIDLDLPPALHVQIADDTTAQPVLHVMMPALAAGGLTGGPNTALILAWHLARAGLRVRVMATVWKPDTDAPAFWRDLARLVGSDERPPTLELLLEHGANQPIAVAPGDWFLATHWHTAYQLRPILPRMQQRRFLYLIQDFEPGFYPFSNNHAACLQSYALDHVPIFNETLVRDYFIEAGIGVGADPALAATALAFEPAVDRSVFHPPQHRRTDGPRRLLFYARPTNPRNLFGTGLTALRAAVADPVFSREKWEFLAIGGAGKMPEFALGDGHVLRQAPWRDYQGYAELLRDSDILLSLMLSPHTSYPVLEMAASGGQVVTNSFGCKTAERLSAMAGGVTVAVPMVENITAALVEAAHRIGTPFAPPHVTLPGSWGEAFASVVPAIARLLAQPAGRA